MWNNKRGFTLIEVAAAVFIIAVGIAGAFTLIQRNIEFYSLVVSQLQATYLAQEGIEITRNHRDISWLDNNSSWSSWKDSLNEKSENFVLKGTVFERTISFEEKDEAIIVNAEVAWQERGRDHSVVVKTKLYNWYGQ